MEKVAQDTTESMKGSALFVVKEEDFLSRDVKFQVWPGVFPEISTDPQIAEIRSHRQNGSFGR